MDSSSRFYVRWKFILYLLPLVLVAAALATRETSLILSGLFFLGATASVVYLFTDYVSEMLWLGEETLC